MIIYGLTGGIGAGKTTVADFFRRLGLLVFDSDVIGKLLLVTDSDIQQAIFALFPDCRANNGDLLKDKLAQQVFSDSQKLRQLESLMHPAILRMFSQALSQLPRPLPAFCLLEGAVLVESQLRFPIAGLIVVAAPLAIRIQRVQKRDRANKKQVLARMQAQLPQPTKLLLAQAVIDNGGSTKQTQEQVEAIANSLRQETGGET